MPTLTRPGDRYHLGLWSEALCGLCLRLGGYRILARRYRSPMGEIDIVAQRRDVVAIIEVKARPTLALALIAISEPQRRRLERAAAYFIAGNPRLSNQVVRFDAMLVAEHGWPRHIKDAWQPIERCDGR